MIRKMTASLPVALLAFSLIASSAAAEHGSGTSHAAQFPSDYQAACLAHGGAFSGGGGTGSRQCTVTVNETRSVDNSAGNNEQGQNFSVQTLRTGTIIYTSLVRRGSIYERKTEDKTTTQVTCSNPSGNGLGGQAPAHNPNCALP